MVDCRDCRFFRSIREMSNEEISKARDWVDRNRPGEQLLGYCTKYRRPITRYRGSCRGYLPREVYIHRLSEYIPGL